MFDAKRLMDQFLGSGGATAGNAGTIARDLGSRVLGSGFGGGAVAGGLAGLLLSSKQGRELGGTVLQLGGIAVVGGLAYKAYQNWQSGKQATPQPGAAASLPTAPGGSPFAPADEAGQQSLARNLLRAMIAAAKADGHIDAAEQANIFAQMDKLPLDADDKAFVMDELRAPLDIDAVARAARTPEEATEIYAASLLSIDIDNAAERGYLAMLAARLKLDDALVAHLHAAVDDITVR